MRNFVKRGLFSSLPTDLSRLSGQRITFLALVLAAVLGVLDYLSGSEIEVTAFYLIPIGWACWGAGRRAGLLLAGVSAMLVGIAKWMSGPMYGNAFIPIWNVLMIMALFSLIAGWLASLKTEITAHERAERAKMQAEHQAERQGRLSILGTLTAGIAHEIRNPLTSLKARLYTLEKHLQGVPAARKNTDIISAEISRLERIVQNVLDFARPSDPILESVAADTLLGEVEGLMAVNLNERGVQLAVELNPEVRLRGDKGQLKQVLINLVNNAADAIEGAGLIRLGVRTTRVQIRGQETEAVVLQVSDTGKGIAPEIEDRLFDPFFTTKESGTGLGLSIAARIVEKHGGKLEYQTRPGHGTTFNVVLPQETSRLGRSAN